MAASEEDHISPFDDDDDEPLKDDDDSSSDSDDDTNSTSSAALPPSSAVSIALLPPSPLPPLNGSDPHPHPHPPPVTAAVVAMPAPTSSASAAAALAPPKPFDDSRKLFQKLWTDEDEIELLRGFLDYTTQRGPNWTGHHHDTTAFYDQIKSRIQLDCNKNQLVEKLRRLKKKYRTAVARLSAGKDSGFKCPHDQTVFDLSRKIWGNSLAGRPEFDDDQNPNTSGAATPAGVGFGIDINSSDNSYNNNNYNKMMVVSMGTPTASRSRKRSRLVQGEEKIARNVVNFGVHEPVSAAAAPVEETVRSVLTPMLKEFVEKIAGGSGFDGLGAKGVGSLASNAIPMSFAGVSSGDAVMDERWRRQQILELEVYSKRLELVQDQIKAALEELRLRGR